MVILNMIISNMKLKLEEYFNRFWAIRSYSDSSEFDENIREFDIMRWNDGWNLLDAIIQKDPLRLINNAEEYLAYSKLAGQYAALEDKLVLVSLEA